MSKAPNPKIFKPMTLKKYLQFLLLGLLWLLLCIPILTIGAATCSVYYVALKILNDETDIHVAKLFFKGIKENFVQGLLMFFISAITLGGTGAFIWWILEKSGRGIPLVCLAIGVCSVALAFTYNRETLRCTGFVAAELAIAGILFRLSLFAGCVSLLFWPSVIFYTIASFMAYIFYRVENPIQYDENGDAIESEQHEETEPQDETENENNNKEIE